MTLQYVLVALGSAIFVFLTYRCLIRKKRIPKERAAKNAGFIDVDAAEICDVRRNKVIISMQRDIEILRNEVTKLKRDVNNNKSNVRDMTDRVNHINR